MAYTADEAVALVSKAIVELDVGPERYTAADPTSVTVDWDGSSASRARRDKMRAVQTEVCMYLPLHQMPQVLLVAEDGPVIGIFGWDIGMRIS